MKTLLQDGTYRRMVLAGNWRGTLVTDEEMADFLAYAWADGCSLGKWGDLWVNW